MIAVIEGQVAIRRQDTSTILTTSGVGYEVYIPAATSARLENPGLVTFHIWHVIREADQRLYGFANRDDRDLAIEVANTDGVGPAKASALVHACGYTAIAAAVRTDDVAGLPKVKGLSADGVKKILAHLRTKGIKSVDERVPAAIGLYRALHGEPSQAAIGHIERLAGVRPDGSVQLLVTMAYSHVAL